MLTKAQAGALKPQVLPVAVPALGEGVEIGLRKATLADRKALMEALNAEGEASARVLDYSAKLVAATAVDAEGALLWTVDEVSALPAQAVHHIAEASANYSGLTGEAKEQAEGNSPATAGGDSSSSSPDISAEPSPNSNRP